MFVREKLLSFANVSPKKKFLWRPPQISAYLIAMVCGYKAPWISAYSTL
jgi:hypothetical protein